MIRVYRYGLLPPHEGAEAVREQMRAAHRYQNALIEIERCRRWAVRAAISRVGDISALEAAASVADRAVEDAARAAKTAKAAARSARPPPDLAAALRHAREVRRAAVDALREARRAIRENAALRSELALLEERAAELRRGARALCGCYWGTYLLIEAAVDAARRAPLYDGAGASDPRYVRWTGEGRVGVQLQGGLSTVELEGDDSRIRIEPAPLPPGADPHSRRSARRRYATLALRVGSTDDREPIWTRWRVVLHRPIPEHARIKAAAVSLRRIGPREEWSVALTLDLSACRPASREGAAVAVDLGWRSLDRGVRVASWLGDDGQAGEVLVEPELLSALRKADDLRAIRDTNFNSARADLVAALGGLTLPAWLSDATRTIAAWRSPARLGALARRWRDARFAGDAAAYDALERWRYHDHHLWEWEASQRTKAHRRRRELYRVLAADLARRYAVLVLEHFDLRKTSRRPQPDAEQTDIAPARGVRQLVAPSECRDALRQAFLARGGRVAVLPAAYTTRTCAQCGSVEQWRAAKYVYHRCSACGATWDQDANAAANLLALYRERPSEPEEAGPAREGEEASDPAEVRESRWAKAKRKKREREARAMVAREAAAEVAK